MLAKSLPPSLPPSSATLTATLTLTPTPAPAATAPESRSGATYNLVSCVTHHGKSPQGGHYTADVRQPSGEWLRFDDERVGAVREADVLGQEAYLLFYVRADGA